MEDIALEVNAGAYPVLRLLGRGKGGYSYLVDGGGGRQLVCKQIHHEPCAYYQFGDKLASELGDYHKLQELGVPLPELLETDRARERILKEYIPGETVYGLVLSGALPPWCLEQVRTISALLRPAGLNIDWFPTNFIPWQGRLYYIGYECNPYSEQWDFEHWGIRYWSRTPEFLRHVQEQTP